MSIVAGSGPESAILMLTGENKGNRVVARQRVWAVHQMQRRQAPIDPVEPEMLCIPVLELISALIRRQQQPTHGDGGPRTVSKLLMYSTCFSTQSSP
jgi:hypothetical protein